MQGFDFKFAKTYVLVFAAHLVLAFVFVAQPDRCTGPSATGLVGGPMRSAPQDAAPYRIDLALPAEMSAVSAGAQAPAKASPPPSKLLLSPPEEPEREVSPARGDTNVSPPPPVEPSPAKPVRSSTSPSPPTPSRASAKPEPKPAVPRKSPEPKAALPRKAEAVKARDRQPQRDRITEPDSKPAHKIPPEKTPTKRPAKPASELVANPPAEKPPREPEPEPRAVPAKLVASPEPVPARPVSPAIDENKEIARAKPVLPAILAGEPAAEEHRDDAIPGGTPTASASMGAYQATVQQMIRSRWNEPKGESSAVMPEVLITINRGGAIVFSRLQRSSGNEVLDRSAMAAVHLRSQLPPLPSDYPQDRYDLAIKFQLD